MPAVYLSVNLSFVKMFYASSNGHIIDTSQLESISKSISLKHPAKILTKSSIEA